jgi:hypothetical protein
VPNKGALEVQILTLQPNQMMMQINYLLVVPVLLLVAGLITWLIKRNSHDEKKIDGKGNPLTKNPDDTLEEL